MKQKAFTLIELLVVISIMAIIAALAIPAILKIKDRADQGNSEVNSDYPLPAPQKEMTVTITKTFVQDNTYYVGTDKGVFFIPNITNGTTGATKLFAQILPGQVYSFTYNNGGSIPAITSAKLHATGKQKLENEE